MVINPKYINCKCRKCNKIISLKSSDKNGLYSYIPFEKYLMYNTDRSTVLIKHNCSNVNDEVMIADIVSFSDTKLD